MKHFLFLISFAFCFSCANALHAKTLQVMSYNVENLFDTKHDVVNGKDKNDWTLLPKETPGKKEACKEEKNKFRRGECFDTDWTEEKVETRLGQISDVILKERKEVPDFLGLVEVENGEIVSRLGKKLGLEQLEITESPDFRGVDVALLYKNSPSIKKITRAEHVVAVDYPTRNILEVEFLIDGKYPLTIFVNHWPSLANPDSWRIKAAEVLTNRVKEILAKNPNMNILAMGDFNTIDSNDPHPFKTVLYKDNLFSDVDADFKADKTISDDVKKKLAPGTYYFSPKDEWNMLDHFFINNNMKDGKEMDVKIATFEIYNPTFITKELSKITGTSDEADRKIILAPKRFNADESSKEKMGYSDHFPILVKLDFPDPTSVAVEAKKEKKKKK
jgi:endonuclease/exonuclease/phosphatase family metal-dependent hydrolase